MADEFFNVNIWLLQVSPQVIERFACLNCQRVWVFDRPGCLEEKNVQVNFHVDQFSEEFIVEKKNNSLQVIIILFFYYYQA